ncbi:MAG TPA: glucose 1-dehydrogenase [Ktedonobacterales bacterium]|jgi:NAD(P)-dependent dehydrogenase (short-subunit alcohol dehydrogenase family)
MMVSPNTSHERGQVGALAGKVALVLGASRGIGAATARAFADAGAAVALAARDAHALESVANAIQEAGGRALAVQTDVSDPEAVARLVARTLDAYGRLDAAFNNAAGGGRPPTPLAEIPIEDYDSALAINLRGVFLAMKYEIPAMLQSGGGAIVNMSSTAGLSGVRGMSAYVASKHGVIGLTKVAALDYAERNIRVNAVAPGPILSDRIKALSEESRAQIAQTVPMRRLGLPEEVAELVVWLCSDQAAFMTGATLTIDGGRLSGGA